jgi:hypothetical protein
VSRSDRPGKDVTLAFITSSWDLSLVATDLLVPSTHPDFAQTGLKTSSIPHASAIGSAVSRARSIGEL